MLRKTLNQIYLAIVAMVLAYFAVQSFRQAFSSSDMEISPEQTEAERAFQSRLLILEHLKQGDYSVVGAEDSVAYLKAESLGVTLDDLNTSIERLDELLIEARLNALDRELKRLQGKPVKEPKLEFYDAFKSFAMLFRDPDWFEKAKEKHPSLF